jgi:glycosyltransferase involved in cell wall biosynthesis
MNYRGDALLAHWIEIGEYTVRVLAPSAGSHDVAEPHDAVVVERIGSYRQVTGLRGIAGRLLQMLRAYRSLRRLLRDESVDVIRTISTLPTVVAVLARGRRRVPIMTNLSDFYEDLYAGSRLPLSRLARALFRRVDRMCGRADLVIVDTPQQRDKWVTHGVARDRCVVIPHGLPRTGSRLIPATRGGDAGRLHLAPSQSLGVYVGDIGQMDGVDLLIEALAQVRAAGTALSLCIVGSGRRSYVDGLRRRAEELGVGDSIVWIPRLPNQSLPALLAQADVCYAPFRLWATSSTSIPNKVLEYLTSTRPIVAPRGSALEAAAGAALDYFTPGDPASLAAISRDVLSRHHVGSEAAEARRRIAAALDWRSVVEHETAVMHVLLQGGSTRWRDYDYAIGNAARSHLSPLASAAHVSG